MNRFFRGALWFVLSGGIILVVCALPGTGTLSWPIDVVTAGSALVAVAITALTATQAVVSWQQQRQREIAAAAWEHRRAVYEPLVREAINNFNGRVSSKEVLVAQRASLALWGTSAVVAAFEEWFKVSVAAAGRDNGNTLDEDRPELFDVLFRAITAARLDLVDASTGTLTVKKDEILSMIFNDYDPDADGHFSAATAPDSADSLVRTTAAR